MKTLKNTVINTQFFIAIKKVESNNTGSHVFAPMPMPMPMLMQMPSSKKVHMPKAHTYIINQGLNRYRLRFSSTHHSDICTAFLIHACWTGLRILRTKVLKSKESTGCFS